MHAPHPTGEIAPGSERVQEVAVEIVFQDLRRAAVGGPEVAIARDDEQVDVRRRRTEAPLAQIFPVLVEHLDAMVLPIVDEHLTRLRIDRDAVDVVEVARPLLVRRVPLLAPRRQVLAVLVELHDARVGVAVGHEHHAVGQPREKCRPVEVRAVIARHAFDAERLHQLLAVVRELVDDVIAVLDDPDVLLGIVGIDRHRMRAPEERIPLRPVFRDVAVGVDDEHAVLPARVDTQLAFPSVPAIAPLVAWARHRADRRVAPRRLRYREGDARPDVRIRNLGGPIEVGKFTALEKEHAIRRLRKNPLRCAERPFLVAWQL